MIRTPQQAKERRVTPGEVHFLANRLRRYFAPASIFPPPGSTRGMTGNRNVSISSGIQANTAPTDRSVIRFGGGRAIYRFTTSFKNPPIIKAIAVTANPNGPQEITLAGYASVRGGGNVTAVILQSSDATDSRLLHVSAEGNPD